MRFTVRRPANAEVSPCCHRPSGGDVACCVDVGVARSGGAGLALEHRLALTVSGSDMPAHRATLRRVGGRDLLDPSIGFVLQPRGEQTPTTAADAPVKPAFLGNPVSGLLDSSARTARHGAHIEGFDPNRVEPARESVDSFSTQSFRRSVSRALSLAIASLVRARRFEPRARGPAAAAAPSTALSHRGSGQPPAAFPRWTTLLPL